MTGIVSVYAVFGSDNEAKLIGRQMIEERLAACVNIMSPCHSIYWWDGKIQEGGEYPAIFKTEAASAPDLIRRISEMHSYDLPAAVAWPVAELPENLRVWIRESVER